MRSSSRGSVLITVIWVLSLLAIYSVAVSRKASQDLLFARWVKDNLLTLNLAKSGVQRALLEIQNDTFLTFDALNESWAINENAFKEVSMGPGTFSVSCDEERFGVCDEAARININVASEEVLTELMMIVQEKPDAKQVASIVHAIMDWRDGDDAQQSDGAESVYYRSLKTPYVPRNNNFETTEELLMVRGITPELFKKLSPWISVYSEGLININTAPALVLRTLGISPGFAEKIMEFRKGGDMILGTKDDRVIQSVESIGQEISTNVSLSGDEVSELSNAVSQGVFTVKSNIFRIRSKGRLIRDGKTLDTTVTCVVQRNGTILNWQETL